MSIWYDKSSITQRGRKCRKQATGQRSRPLASFRASSHACRQASLRISFSAGTKNEEWLRVSTAVGVNTFTIVLFLRALPPLLRPLHPLIVRCLPARFKLHGNLRVARKLTGPILEEDGRKKHHERSHGNHTASPLLTRMNPPTLTKIIHFSRPNTNGHFHSHRCSINSA